MNKKIIMVAMGIGTLLLMGSFGIMFYAVHQMNKVEDMMVFVNETTETTTITTTIETMTEILIEEETTEETVKEVMTEIPPVIETVPPVNNTNNSMTRGQWYEENGYGGAPEQEESFDHDEYMYIKNNNTYMGEFKVNIELVERITYGFSDTVSEGDAVAGVDTGLNVGDEIYVAGCGHFTVVGLTDLVIYEKDERIVCFADKLLYGPNGLNLGYFDADVYLIE